MNLCKDSINSSFFLIIILGDDKTNKEDYLKLVGSQKIKSSKLKNILIAFFSGGLLGFVCELISFCLVSIFKISKMDSYGIVCFLIIFLSTLFTSLGFFDNFVSKCKCGLIIPTTGFAHSVSSSTLEYKKEGLITGIGSNYLKLAGSVILYGIISSITFLLIKMVIIWL